MTVYSPVQISRPNEDSDDFPMYEKETMPIKSSNHNLPTSNLSKAYIQISRKKFSDDKKDKIIEEQRNRIFEQAKREQLKREELEGIGTDWYSNSVNEYNTKRL